MVFGMRWMAVPRRRDWFKLLTVGSLLALGGVVAERTMVRGTDSEGDWSIFERIAVAL